MTKYTFKDVQDSIGEELTVRFEKIIKKDYLAEWYFQAKLPGYDNKHPCELKKSELEKLCASLEFPPAV